MNQQAQSEWVVLDPPFPENSLERQAFYAHAVELTALLNQEDDDENFDKAIQDLTQSHGDHENLTSLNAILCVLSDLARQRWSMRINKFGDLEVQRPQGDHLNPLETKARIRAQELIKRDEQLRESSARRFIAEMERKSIYKGHHVSIFSLFRDGREFAESLRATRSLTGEERIYALRVVIDPYLQFVDKAKYCDHTGLRLQDIWRYFRHTWTNQYSATPGRSMAFLVRDRAREYHPVIGIGSLGSPIIQIRERDAWIGWQPEEFLRIARDSPSPELGQWLLKTVGQAIGEIYLEDFFEEELLSPTDFRNPTLETLQRLIAYGENQRELHYRLARSVDLKQSLRQENSDSTEEHWKTRARTHLYRSKRALLLAEMFRSRTVIHQYLSPSPGCDEVRNLLNSAEGRRVVKRILRKAKADRVGIAMADITVCGALPPYNIILGGKLVSMLAASPEVVSAYREKYVSQESEIASSMAGRPIVRRSELVFLGTTSLYGIGSSQYNRLHMPTERIGGRKGDKLSFIEIGKSESFGTSQFSSGTVKTLVSLVQQTSNGQRVNSIFGEGVSPKLRKIRDGLVVLNLPADNLLKHGRQRIVYGVPVISNLIQFLVGMDDEPEYMYDLNCPEHSTKEIGQWWMERWLSKRIESDEILDRVEQHTLISPVRHGARVVLPDLDKTQMDMFEDLVY